MKQSEALEEFKKLFPEDAEFLKVERMHSIGYKHGCYDEFILWNWNLGGTNHIAASSYRSWEHALAIAKSGNEDVWPEDHSPIEGEEDNAPV
jgi:hypothetical protein